MSQKSEFDILFSWHVLNAAKIINLGLTLVNFIAILLTQQRSRTLLLFNFGSRGLTSNETFQEIVYANSTVCIFMFLSKA